MNLFQPGRKLADYEREIILAAYKFHGQNKTKTAESLGIAIRTLDSKLAIYTGEKPKGDDGNGSTINIPVVEASDGHASTNLGAGRNLPSGAGESLSAKGRPRR